MSIGKQIAGCGEEKKSGRDAKDQRELMGRQGREDDERAPHDGCNRVG